jgi:hypothetical protein
LWTDPEGDAIVEYGLDFSDSDDSALPAGWSFNTETGLMTVDISSAGNHTGWRMTAQDDQVSIGLSETFSVLVVAVSVVTFRFQLT